MYDEIPSDIKLKTLTSFKIYFKKQFLNKYTKLLVEIILVRNISLVTRCLKTFSLNYRWLLHSRRKGLVTVSLYHINLINYETSKFHFIESFIKLSNCAY